DGIGRDAPFRGEISQEIFDGLLFAHVGPESETDSPNLFDRSWIVPRSFRVTSSAARSQMPLASIQSFMTRSARAENISRFCFLSLTFSVNSSRSPKLAFIGWKCLGSASFMYR